MDFWRAVGILDKRKWLILLSVVVAMGLTFVATRLIGSRWIATVRLAAASTSPLTGSATTEREENDVIAARNQAKIYAVMVKGGGVMEPALRSLRQTQVPADLLKNIEVEAAGPGLFLLSVTDSSPSRAEALANALANSLKDWNKQLSTDAAVRVVKLLEGQLHKANVELRRRRQKFEQYRRQHQIVVNLNEQLTPALTRLQSARLQRDDVSERLAEAKARLAARQAELAKMPASIPLRAAGEMSPLAKQLEAQLAEVRGQLTALRSRYTENHIEVRKAVAAEAALQADLDKEVANVAASNAKQPNPELQPLREAIRDLKRDITGYQAQLNVLGQSVKTAGSLVSKFTGVDGPLGALAQDVAEQTETRANIAARLQSARMALDVAESQDPIKVVDPVGEFNPAQNSTQGRTQKLLLLAAFCALMGTSGVIIALDSIDRRVRTISDAERVLAAPLVTAIPLPLGAVTTATLARTTELHPLSLHSEAYRFLGLHLLNARGPRVQSLMVISAKADQGSTNTVTNLGITLAQAGQRVVIVDANIRTPQVHGVFGMANDFGLTDLLAEPDGAAFEQALKPTSVPNLRVITSGSATENPWELFRSQNLLEVSHRLRDLADYVIYDTPSALAFTDALNLTPAVDAAFLCVRALEQASGAEQRLVQWLEQAGVTVLGSVLSDVPASVLESYQNYQRYYPTTGTPTNGAPAPVLATGPALEAVAPIPASVNAQSWIQMPENGASIGYMDNGFNGNGQNGGPNS